MIKLKHVCKDYEVGEKMVRVLDDITFEIRDGEYVGILGSSGSGKSTLMHIIGLLDVPSAGDVILEGKNVAHLKDDQISHMRNRYVGFVFQQFNLIEKLSVKDNVLLPTQYLRGKLDFDTDAWAEELLERFGIAHRKDYFPNKISGGQQQRVAIARALIMKPKLILADEPTGNLDSKTGEEILELIEELNKDLGVTVVLVTHEEDVAQRTRRQIYLQDGVIVNSLKK